MILHRLYLDDYLMIFAWVYLMENLVNLQLLALGMSLVTTELITHRLWQLPFGLPLEDTIINLQVEPP